MTFSVNSSEHKSPLARITLNDKIVFDDVITNTVSFVVDRVDMNYLSITHYNKIAADTVVDENGSIISDIGFNLDSISLCNLEFSSVYLNWFPFKPDYTLFGNGPAVLRNNLYFGFNGTYSINFYGDPEKQKYYQEWINETQSNYNQQLPDDKFNRFGQEVGVDSGLDLTIHDLARMVENG